MRTLGWMQKRFWKNNEQSTNVSTGKSHSCFSSLWELDEHQHYPEANNNSAQFKQRVALEVHGLEIVKEEIVEMKPEFLHGLLAIGTLGSVMIITKDPITKETAIDAEETSAGEQILNNNVENLTEKELEKDTKENKNAVVCPPKEYYEMTAIKEDEKEQKEQKCGRVSTEHTLKKNATSYKRPGIQENGVRTEARAFHFMKKMLKKLDFTLSCSTTSVFHSTAIICDSPENTHTKVFRKSRKIHPEAADINANKSHKSYEVKMCYDKEKTSDDEDDMYHQERMFKKETITNNMVAHRPSNVQPAGRKAHWIKTDADYVVLEF